MGDFLINALFILLEKKRLLTQRHVFNCIPGKQRYPDLSLGDTMFTC